MTLIAGFKCTDGFVIASDTEMTLGAISFQGQKVAIYDLGAPDTLWIALSGNVAFGLVATQAIGTAVLNLQNRELPTVKRAVADALGDVYSEQIFKIWAATGRNDADDFALILGIEGRDRNFAVLSTHLNTVHEVAHYEFSGSGSELAHYVAERLCSSPTTTAVTHHLVSQIFREIKSKGIFVGGNTEIRSRRSRHGDAFFEVNASREDYRFLWGLDDALMSAVRVALDHKGHRPLPGHKLPKRLEERIRFIRKRLAELHADSARQDQKAAGEERHATEFGTEYGNPFKDF